jgi:hypothetical protein
LATAFKIGDDVTACGPGWFDLMVGELGLDAAEALVQAAS